MYLTAFPQARTQDFRLERPTWRPVKRNSLPNILTTFSVIMASHMLPSWSLTVLGKLLFKSNLLQLQVTAKSNLLVFSYFLIDQLTAYLYLDGHTIETLYCTYNIIHCMSSSSNYSLLTLQ